MLSASQVRKLYDIEMSFGGHNAEVWDGTCDLLG